MCPALAVELQSEYYELDMQVVIQHWIQGSFDKMYWKQIQHNMQIQRIVAVLNLDSVFSIDCGWQPQIIDQIKLWFAEEVNQATQVGVKVILNSDRPHRLDPFIFQNLLTKVTFYHKDVFIDFPDLKLVKIMLANEIIRLEARSSV